MRDAYLILLLSFGLLVFSGVVAFAAVPDVEVVYSPGASMGDIHASSDEAFEDRIVVDEDGMILVNISIENEVFIATFFDNEASHVLIEQMPMTLNMSDLHNNEKYFHFSESLPAISTERPQTIHAGEIMCWSGNSLVLFYDTFSNSYGGYIRLGYIEDISGLKEAVGTGDVSVTFSTF